MQLFSCYLLPSNSSDANREIKQELDNLGKGLSTSCCVDYLRLRHIATSWSPAAGPLAVIKFWWDPTKAKFSTQHFLMMYNLSDHALGMVNFDYHDKFSLENFDANYVICTVRLYSTSYKI